MLLDLELRVHAPIPEVVIVRVSGTVNRLTAAALAQRVGQQLGRAPHVVVDLGEVTVRDPRDLAVLVRLHQQASANGTQIYIARAERETVRRALRITGLEQVLILAPSADAVIAGLPLPHSMKGPRSSARSSIIALSSDPSEMTTIHAR